MSLHFLNSISAAQDLVKKGLVAPGRGGVEEEKKEFYRDVTINDAPPPIRHHLTKRSTQDDIARRTGTVLTVKGRYYSPGEPEDEAEKPLFLRVTPGLCLQDVSPPTPFFYLCQYTAHMVAPTSE